MKKLFQTLFQRVVVVGLLILIQLALLLTIDGVQNFTTLTVNGGTEDVSIPAGSVPTVGTVSVT